MGKVYLVGAGPGDPELITLKGLKAIKEADVILYDRLVNKEILNYASLSTKFFYCGKDPHRHSLPQEKTNKMMVTLAKRAHSYTFKGWRSICFWTWRRRSRGISMS